MKIDIKNWDHIKHKIKIFMPILTRISKTCNIDFDDIEPCIPSSNAVFKTKEYIIKIFPPKQICCDSDYLVEVEALKHFDGLDVKVPKLLSNGRIHFIYPFDYIVMTRVKGSNFSIIEGHLEEQGKYEFAKRIRAIQERLNTKCVSIRAYDPSDNNFFQESWSEFPSSFVQERVTYLKSLDFNETVFVNGDLNPDNVLIDNQNEIYIIDFGDAYNAPVEYELACMMCYLFAFEAPYIKPYLEAYSLDELVDKCFKGVLLHKFGSNMIKCNFGNPEDIGSLKELKRRIHTTIVTGLLNNQSLEYLNHLKGL